MTVSVIVPCYNAEPYLDDSLGSVMRQRDIDFELIAIDDGSTDGTAAMIAERFPQARLVRTPNCGVSAARELGVSLAKGEFIQYLDADDKLADGKLAKQAAALAGSDAEVAYGDYVKFGDGETPETVTARLGDDDPALELFSHFWRPPAVYLYRRTIVERLTWHQNLPIIQDARYALDAALAGARFLYTPGTVAGYRVLPAGRSLSTQSQRRRVRDYLTNAREIEDRWRQADELNEPRRQAVAGVYTTVIESSYRVDPDTYELAFERLSRLVPGYAPARPAAKRLLAQLIGYRRTVAIGYRLRQLR